MKKCYTGKVTLLTLLVSVASLSFSSQASDDEEILKLFNETARSLPSASSGTAQSREETLSIQLKALQRERNQLQKRIRQLETLKAQNEAKAQVPRTTDETERLIENLEEEIRKNKQTIASQQSALKAAEAKISGQQTDAKIANLNQQLQASEKQRARLQQEKQSAAAGLNQQLAERQKALESLQAKLEATEKQLAQLQREKQSAAAGLNQQLAERQKALESLQAKLEATEKQLAQLQQEKQSVNAKETPPQSKEQEQLTSQLAALQQQYQQSQQENEKQRQRADSLEKELTQLSNLVNTSKALAQDVNKAVKPESPASSPLPQSEAERDSYALGQFLAANVGAQIKIIKDAGITILSDPLSAGLTTKLNNGKSAISDKEMEARYKKLDEKVSQGMNMLIAKGYEKLQKKIGGRKALKQSEGMSWFTVKPVKSQLKDNAVVAVNVKVTTLEGKVINDFSDDRVTFTQDLPPLLYEGLSLTGKHGEIEGWALAQDIFEREPLPGWVAPYDVVHYQLSVK